MELLTERLLLREMTTADVNVVASYRTDPKYLEHYPRSAYSRSECEEFVAKCMRWASEKPRCKYQLAITLKDDGVLLGNCGIRCESIEVARGDIGYELSPQHWRQGLATEAVAAMVQFGFEALNLDELEARTVTANQRSIQVLSRLAFRKVERIPPGLGRGGYQWPERSVFLLSRADWESG